MNPADVDDELCAECNQKYIKELIGEEYQMVDGQWIGCEHCD